MSSDSHSGPDLEALELMRRSVRLRVDDQGRWYHNGDPFEHARLAAVFSRGLDLHPESGEATVTIGERFCYVECDQTPFLVTRIAMEADRLYAILNNEDEFEIPYNAFFQCEGRVALRIGPRRWARLSRGVYDRLAEYLTEAESGYSFVLPAGIYPVAAE